MAAERKPGSDRGRPSCDWEAAFVFWAGLPAEERSYGRVAEEFGVSVRTVERRGRDGGWRERLSAINAQAAVEIDLQLGRKKAEYVARLRKLLEATLVGYAENLRDRQIRMTPGDLDRLYKLWRLLDDELDSTPAPGTLKPAAPARTIEHTTAVIKALAESGALAGLGLQVADVTTADGIDSEDTDYEGAS
jgi:hypothetical protein